MPYSDPEKQRQYQRERNAGIRKDWLDKNGPCKICGNTDRLEVDHIDPTTKVDHKVWTWAKERREKELAKCQVLCYICHLAKSVVEKSKPVTHGTHTGYSHYGCRCPDCTLAQREYQRAYIADWTGSAPATVS